MKRFTTAVPTWMYVVTRKAGGPTEFPLSMSWWLIESEARAEFTAQSTLEGVTMLHERQLDGSNPVLLSRNAPVEKKKLEV